MIAWRRLPDAPPDDPQGITAAARALLDRWVAELGREPAETVAVFRFLVAMAAVRLGELRELGRVVRDGRPVAGLVDPRSESFY